MPNPLLNPVQFALWTPLGGGKQQFYSVNIVIEF
jgi:hypothetical protein